MTTTITKYIQIDSQIMTIDKTICACIAKFSPSERGFLSQTILSQLRNFVEHIMLKVFANGQDIDNSYENICKALAYVKAQGNLRQLSRFHHFLEIVASHYTLDEENSERLMLKYYEYLLRIKDLLKIKYSLDVLKNIDNFPVNVDTNLKEYYEKIASKVNNYTTPTADHSHSERFYIQKIKPFFVDHKIYYEVTFTAANDRTSKFDRMIAFTALDIPAFYAVKLHIAKDSIDILGKTMPVWIIFDWESSIRPCELSNFSRLFGSMTKFQSGNTEYRELMRFLTETGSNFIDVIDFSDLDFQSLKNNLGQRTSTLHFFDVLDKARQTCRNKQAGSNVIRYLLYHLNNKIVKSQHQRTEPNSYLSSLYLKNGCIPFDKMPFATSLVNHNPKLTDLFQCIDSSNRKHELLARFIRNNTELYGNLYTSVHDVVGFDDLESLIRQHNDLLWAGHPGRTLCTRNNHLYIREYEDDTLAIISRLKDMAKAGVPNYANSVYSWLRTSTHLIDCPEKRTALAQMFEHSSIALIYGSAGTGKSTLINHISHFFADYSKLYLANTNPAVDNLKRRVDSANCTFSTVKKFLLGRTLLTEYAILIIDECSTVSNRDMRDILNKASFSLLILVGDVYQIEAIRFGNWFGAARSFIPNTSVFELTTPYRSQNVALLDLWKRVRNMDDTILEHIAKKDYSSTLDESFFERPEEGEIILCLNYDGLYGINNINRFLQQSNPNPDVHWGIQDYKIGDPILFNESDRFAPLIYNNMKGKIVAIDVLDEESRIQFDIELDIAINGMNATGYDFTLQPNSASGDSVIRFTVNRFRTTDEDDDASASDVVPFQVAYAVSIHKAQGLEYDSVKIVITNEVDELITHNIFYTAITRARKQLKIYWTPEVERKVLNRIKPATSGKDVALLRLCVPSAAAGSDPVPNQ